MLHQNRQASVQALIEITPEMIEAGGEIVAGFDLEFDNSRDTAIQIFLAMCAAHRSPDDIGETNC